MTKYIYIYIVCLHSEEFCLWPNGQGREEVWFLFLKITKELRHIVKNIISTS